MTKLQRELKKKSNSELLALFPISLRTIQRYRKGETTPRRIVVDYMLEELKK